MLHRKQFIQFYKVITDILLIYKIFKYAYNLQNNKNIIALPIMHHSHYNPQTSWSNKYNHTDPYSQNDNAQSTITSLLRKNEELQDKFNEERSKNYDLLELKKRMEEDLQRAEFEFDRLKNHQSLFEKQTNIKNYQLLTQVNKQQSELDSYLHENKQLREQIRQLSKNVQHLEAEKQILAKQNIYLRKEVDEWKYKYEGLQNNRENYVSPKKANNSSSMFISTNCEQGARASYLHAQTEKSNYNSPHKPMNKIYEQFYEDCDEIYKEEANMSPRSFQNMAIQRNFSDKNTSQIPVSQMKYPKSVHVENFTSDRKVYINAPDNNDLKTYKSEYSSPNYEPQIDNTSRQVPQITIAKKNLNQQVTSLRDELIALLLQKTYQRSISDAQDHHKNALKIFIEYNRKISGTLAQMSSNYLQARQALIDACPTARQRYEVVNNSSPNSHNIYKIYKSVKENAKKENSESGQYLALFRLLTLISKINKQQIDEALIVDIKHSALKYAYKITSKKINQ